VPFPIAVIAMAREGLVAVSTVALAMAGARRIDVTLVGKAGTFGLMLAFPLFLAGHSTIGWHHTALVLAWVAAVIGLALGWASVVLYVPLARRALADGEMTSSVRSPSFLSLWSDGSALSIASKGSFLSIGSVGSVLSIGSTGSFLSAFSIGSAGSVLSLLSAGSRLSVMSFRSSKAVLASPRSARLGQDGPPKGA
jgi:hypothetical protein